MTLDTSSFGRAIASARKDLGISQKELAGKIFKEEGDPITPQYLNDIEHNKRTPSSDNLVQQFAAELKISPNILYLLAGRVPGDIVKSGVTPEKIDRAFKAFRRELRDK